MSFRSPRLFYVDNTPTNTGTGGDTIATDELVTINGVAAVGVVKVQRMKVGFGSDGIFRDVDAANPLPSKISDGTNNAGVEPFGALQINNGFQTLFYDSWSLPLDTTDKWTVVGNAPVIAIGNMTMSATLSSYNAIRTKDIIRANVGFTLVRNGIAIETAVTTGCGRFWGLGTPATTPSATSLAQDGAGFELDQTTGALQVVTYAAGTKTVLATLTAPTDGLNHAYGTYVRVTTTYWILDGVTVFTKAFPNIQVAELPALIVRQNAAAFTGTPAFVNIAHLTADTSRQGVVISDPQIGTRQMRVDASGAGKTTLSAAVTSPVTILQNAVSVTGNGTTLIVTGYGTAVLQIGGVFVGTISFETFNSLAGTWVPISATQIGAGDIFSVATVPGVYRMTVAGLDSIRARVTLTSGSITIDGRATNAINASKIMKLATGGLTIGKVILTDNTNNVGITSAAIGGNETTLDRLKVNASLRMIDNAQAVGSKLVGVTGTQAGGLDVNVKNSSPLAQTITAVSGAAATLSLPAVTGLFHYITSLDIRLYSAAARTGVATPIVVTTGNLPGAIAFTFDTAGAIGTSIIQDLIASAPLKVSVANTATTIVAPAVVGGIWRITALYFTGV